MCVYLLLGSSSSFFFFVHFFGIFVYVHVGPLVTVIGLAMTLAILLPLTFMGADIIPNTSFWLIVDCDNLACVDKS